MFHFARTLLICVFWLSALIIVPYAFFSYICYAGICGGDLAATIRDKHYFTKVYGIYFWLYPTIGAIVTIYSIKLKNKFLSLFLLVTLLLFSIPIACVYYQEKLIKEEIRANREFVLQPHYNDFICTSNIFVRINSPSMITVYKTVYNKYGAGHETANFNSYPELIGYLLRNNIDIKNCKNGDNVAPDHLYAQINQ